ncbi:uncharacterized protein LOC113361509 [Papaver somniferum]|uniref:uncharacterized protein LOC113361509 n=1 Tax=Papaver somniferum TaxID=3469 RepID=UPI000E6FE736|nr:uncharacterized protein LOC113361509 [Papaver somniferum]
MEEVEYPANLPGSHIVLQGRNDSFAHIKGRDKGGRVRCLGNAVKPKKYWGEESSSQATNDLNVENVNFRQQLEITIGDLQAAMKRISELEAQLATRDETGTANGHLQEALKKIAELEEEVESLKMVQDFRIGDMLRT